MHAKRFINPLLMPITVFQLSVSLLIFLSFYLDLVTAYEVLSDEKKRKQYDRFGEEGMKQQPGFEGFNFNFDDFFKGFGGGFKHEHSHEHRSRGGGFKFNFDDLFNHDNGDDEDEDSIFGADRHGFGGFGFGDDVFSFGSHQSTFTRQESRSSGTICNIVSYDLLIICQNSKCISFIKHKTAF